MQNAPSETAELLDRLCTNPSKLTFFGTRLAIAFLSRVLFCFYFFFSSVAAGGRISASQFIKIFVNNRLGLIKFLERYIEVS